jgi:hypothetical protein
MIGTASQATRIGKLEDPSKPGTRPGGVLVMPPVLDCEGWESIAIPQQAALAVATRGGIDGEPRSTEGRPCLN